MKLTQEQYEKISKYLPRQRGNVRIAKRVEFLKDNKRGVRKMCKIIEDLFAEELEEGKKESEKKSKLEDIRNLMETLNRLYNKLWMH